MGAGRFTMPKKRCGKNNYDSEDKARRVAVTAFMRDGTRLRVYQCPDCGYWHLTHKSPYLAWGPNDGR